MAHGSQEFVIPSREESQARMDRVFACTTKYKLSQRYTIADRWEERVAETPDAPFIFFEQRTVSVRDMERAANRMAHWALAQGLKQGDVVALMAGNSPEYVMVWLGLAKVGVITALLNPHNSGDLLIHALTQTGAKVIIYDRETAPQVASIPDHDVARWEMNGPGGATGPALANSQSLDAALARMSETAPDRAIRQDVTLGSVALYVFTSGTTGRPKAALQSHYKFLIMGETTGALLELGPGDVYYNVLPLYHGAGGETLISASITFNVPFVLRRKFSTREFWNDVRRHKVTTMQYIGEVCRYLTNAPEVPGESDHTLRKMSGAGMRPDVMEEFQRRFGPIRIHETYGGTELNCGIMNIDRKPGAVGRIPFPQKHLGRLVRYDVDAGDYIRDDKGFLIECQPGEVGEFIAIIPHIPDSGAGWFEGYISRDASDAKVLRNVFREGDEFFRSGDLMKRDADDYYYFTDRIGDTFRWKSENVSTMEVAGELAGFNGASMVNIYGVEVPNTEGRAGMAALSYDDPKKFDPKAFYELATKRLPHYAVPVFVRLAPEADMTGSFKLRKVDLQREGYDPQRTADPLFVKDDANRTYVPVTEASLKAAGLPPFKGR